MTGQDHGRGTERREGDEGEPQQKRNYSLLRCENQRMAGWEEELERNKFGFKHIYFKMFIRYSR